MSLWLWVGFVAFIFLALAFDLFVAHRKPHDISIKEALGWTVFWVVISLMFNVLVFFIYENHWLKAGELSRADAAKAAQIAREHPAATQPEAPHGLLDTLSHADDDQEVKHLAPHTIEGREAALNFFTGYLVEKSLSLDNIFVIAIIFAYFGVANMHQHRVLFWGILGAMVMRGLMIWGGVALIKRFDWVIYIFAGLLLFSAVKMMRAGDDSIEPEHNPLVRLARKFFPVSNHFEGQKFFTRIDGKFAVTPLFLVLLVVESTDLLFAVDSIPAIIAITDDPFLVFTSNVFAILGLRSLYFALAGMMDKFKYLKMSLVFLLAFIAVKMMLAGKLNPDWLHYHIPTPVSLAVIAGILVVGVAASMLASGKRPKAAAEKEPDDREYKT